MAKKALRKIFGLGALLIYGIGDILGAGIYALIGKIASESGPQVWISLAVALFIAMLTALSYAELTRRHPKSGGASYFIQVATGKESFGFLIGWLLLCVSIVSMATLARAFVGYIEGLNIGGPVFLIVGLFLGALTLINLRGIKESSWANMVSTSIEVFGLIVVAAAGIYFLRNPTAIEIVHEARFTPLGILEGAAIAFYAFIGFEDLANVAEESKNPRHDLPIAIIGSLFGAGLMYIFIGWISTQVLSTQALAASSNPLTEIVAQSGLGFPLKLFGVIALFAVANTCLLNFVTGSRLLYGMAEQKLIPAFFSEVHKKYRTPHKAILAIFPIAMILAILGELKFLANTTSILILLVFCSTNFSLIKIKKNESEGDGFRIPAFIPWLGMGANILLILFSDRSSLLAASGFLLVGGILYLTLQKWSDGRRVYSPAFKKGSRGRRS